MRLDSSVMCGLIALALLTGGMLTLSGCVTVQPWHSSPTPTRRAVVTDLLSGQGQEFARLCIRKGLDTRVIPGEKATWGRLRREVTAAYAGMRTDDLLVLYVHTHGRQWPDGTGDERDRKDEVLCLVNRDVYDHELERLLNKAPCRVFVVIDACHGGTMLDNPTSPVVYFAATTDERSGYGGNWTSALIGAIDGATSYTDWYIKALDRMPRSMIVRWQAPQYQEYGNPWANERGPLE